jgi:uncharacterized membrane protein
MQTFISDISQKAFPLSEKVNGKSVRDCVLDEIKKEYPLFSDDSLLSISELNEYRHRYIHNSLASEMGALTEMESKVLEALKKNETISETLGSETAEPFSFGQRLADKVASFGGSWRFIIIFGVFIVIWMLINVIVLTTKAFDPYPFILLNLILSCIAALQAPVIMMSQNRQEEKDRERAKKDYMINLKSELEIRMLHEKMDYLLINQQEQLMQIQQIQVDMMNDIMQRLKK